jgi:hypothetical protein
MSDLSETVTQKAAMLLNQLLSQDPKALTELIRFGVNCKPELEQHPDILVREVEGTPPRIQISFLSILNSILLKSGQRRVAVVEVEGSPDILAFKPYRSASE